MNNTGKFDFLSTEVSRRQLVKNSALGGVALAATGIALPFGTAKATTQAENTTSEPEKIVWSMCSVNCGSRCALRLHVKNDEVIYVETDNTGNDEFGDHQVRACLRGRSIRRRMNHPDRLKYPMKRVGKRGEGKFERISWDEAFDIIGTNMRRIIKDYGNDAIHVIYGTGVDGGNITNSNVPYRLMNCAGGFLQRYNNYSLGQLMTAMPYTYGADAGNSITDIQNTKLVVMFGNNPAETRMSGGGITYNLQQARLRSNAKMIMIDPRYNDTAAGREDEWVPIRPGTDAALVAGMAHVMITEDLVDHDFLSRYCVGYDETTLPASAPKNGHYKAYILGQGNDQTEKTPEWAASITGIPATQIVRLAREIAATKPAYIVQGWGPQRQANGEQTSRAIAMLAILTGNVGINGGNTGSREGTYAPTFEWFPMGSNPVKQQISCFTWTDAIDRGLEMTAKRDGIRGADKLNNPIKMLFCYASNMIGNQHSQINRTHEILQDESKCEFILNIEHFMTSSAKYADILLPDLMTTEQEETIPNEYAGDMGYIIFGQAATSAKFERKPIYEILGGIAKQLGDDVYEKFTEGRTQAQWLRHLYAQMQEQDPSLPSYEEAQKRGVVKKQNPDGFVVAFKEFREDPIAHPLATPSGKIEIYSERLAEVAKSWELKEDEVITALPIYTPGFESPQSPEAKTYPLQMIGFHYKARTHSCYGNIDVLKAACPQEIWMNPIDAQQRGIKQGDTVRVFNERGELHILVKVTPRIIPGVTAISEGAWHDADMFGDKVDKGGCINVLTTQRPSPLAKCNPSHSNMVEVAKI